MRLNKITNHAVRILSACAHDGKNLKKAGDLAVELGLSPQNTVKILHILTRAGFLQSTRGRNGGVRLALPAEEIYIGTVVREIEAGLGDMKFPLRQPNDGFDALVDDAFSAFLEVLDGQTLADLIKTPRKSRSQNKKPSKRKSSRVLPPVKPRKTNTSRSPATRS